MPSWHYRNIHSNLPDQNSIRSSTTLAIMQNNSNNRAIPNAKTITPLRKAVARRLMREQKNKAIRHYFYSYPTHGMTSCVEYVCKYVHTPRPCKFQYAQSMPAGLAYEHSYNFCWRRRSYCHFHKLEHTSPELDTSRIGITMFLLTKLPFYTLHDILASEHTQPPTLNTHMTQLWQFSLVSHEW
jgi:hypothetical protein